jgi:hypothetical protein
MDKKQILTNLEHFIRPESYAELINLIATNAMIAE